MTTLNEVEDKALVHSIESCGVFDGPGIRTVIFLQGCKLRCLYCHNPDTWSLKGTLEMSSDELLKKVRQFDTFLMASGGGVTVSGGEPLLQKKFILHFFKELQEEGFHTCIDTNGMVALDDTTDELLDLTDLILLDIKALDPEEHKVLTGKTNELPLAFLAHLAERKQRTWIRHVVVPGYTDDLDRAKSLAQHLAQYSNIEQVDLLPFHKMGEFKFQELNLKYHLADTQPPSSETMEQLKQVFMDAGLKVT